MSDSLDSARALLPAYATWGTLWYVAFAAVVGCATSRVGTWRVVRAYRRVPPGAHWTERARAAHFARLGGAFAIVYAMLIVGVGAFYVDGELARVPFAQLVRGAIVVAMVAAMRESLRIERIVRREPLSSGAWLRSLAVRAVVFYPHFWIAIALAFGVHAPLHAGGIAVVVAGCGAIVVACTGAGLFLGVALGLATPASPRLRSLVEEAAAKANVPPPRTYELDWSVANAVAFPWLGRIAFTKRAIASLTDAQIVAVASHEIGHLTESRWVGAARLAASCTLVLSVALVPLTYATWGVLGPPATLVVAFVVLRVARKLFRRMEERADAAAHAHETDAGTYARALERLYETNLVPAVLGASLVHPALYDRLVSAGVKPDYPRPAAPTRRERLAVSLPTMVVAIVLDAGACVAATLFAGGTSSESQALRAIAVRGGNAGDVVTLAGLREGRGDTEGALTLLRAVYETEPTPYATGRLAILLAASKRCDEARSVVLGGARALTQAVEERCGPGTPASDAKRDDDEGAGD